MVSLFFTIFAALFSVVDPLGVMPVFLAMTPDCPIKERNSISLRTSTYFVIISIAFFFAGGIILHFFGISIDSIRIAGGLIIMMSGFALLRGKFSENRAYDTKVKQEAIDKEDISFTPLAMPLLSGPGSISLLITYHAEFTDIASRLMIVSSIVILGVIIYLILRSSPLIFKAIGYGGLRSISRIMGFIVIAIGVEYIVSGIVDLVEKTM